MKEKNVNKSAYVYVSVVAIIAIVAMIFLISDGNKVNTKSINVGSVDLLGDAVRDSRVSGEIDEVLCFDTDGGIEPTIFGAVRYNNRIFEDRCLSPTTLLENYCHRGIHQSINVECGDSQECIDGACVDINFNQLPDYVISVSAPNQVNFGENIPLVVTTTNIGQGHSSSVSWSKVAATIAYTDLPGFYVHSFIVPPLNSGQSYVKEIDTLKCSINTPNSNSIAINSMADSKYNITESNELNNYGEEIIIECVDNSPPPQNQTLSCDGFGDGSLENPFEIYNCQDLQNVKNDLTAHYEVCSNIDCSATINWNNGEGFEPIGRDIDFIAGNPTNCFEGSLNGNDYLIYDLYISRGGQQLGLFGCNYGQINNVHLRDAYIKANTIYPTQTCGIPSNGYGQSFVGVLVGFNPWNSNNDISNCSATGTINAIRYCKVGGLVGNLQGTKLSNSYAIVDIEAAMYVGGLVGGSVGSRINNSYARGDVIGSLYSSSQIGGLVGNLHNGDKIDNSYSTGFVSGSQSVGGLVGSKGTAYNLPEVTNSYYDMQTSGQNDTGKGTPKTTAQMKQQSTFIGWDFDSVWAISSHVNEGYPYLQG